MNTEDSRPWARYTVAIALVVAATISRATVDPVLAATAPYGFHFVAVVIVAWVAGFRASLAAAFASALIVDFLFMEPRFSLMPGGPINVGAAATFVALSAAMAWQISRRRTAERVLVESRDALQQRAERLALHATLLNHAHDAIIVRDPEQRITVWNREAESLYGWSAAEAEGQNLHDLLDTDDDAQQAMRSALVEGGTWSGTIRHRRKDGSHVLCESRQAVVDSGVVLEVNRDVTERVRAEEAILANERTLTALMDAATESILLLDRTTVLVSNATAAARFGKSVDQVRGTSWRAYLTPELAATRAARIDEVFATGQPVQFEDERAGICFEHTYYPAFAADGAVAAIAAFSRDVTEHRRAETALRDLSQRLTYHVSHSPLAVIEFGPDMRVTQWTGEAKRVFGWTAEEVVGKHMSEFPWVHEDDVAHVREVTRDLRTGAHPRRFSANRNRRKDGTVVFCEWYNSSLVDASGQLQSILSLVLDVTERTRLEEQLRAQAQALATANRVKDEFLATLSHELRTPLHAILGWSQLLATNNEGNESLRRGLSAISRNAQVQTQLVEDLLDVSRIVTGSLRLHMEVVDIRDIADRSVEALGQAADAKQLRVELQVESGLTLHADPVRLQQVAWNLLSNAVKFTPPGGTVTIAAHRTAQELELTVGDSGVGIHRDFLPHVFERFSQEDASLTRAHGGLGLGLAIVRHIVELHGGTVSACSEGEGRGSLFTVKLPVGSPAPDDRSLTHAVS
jgi:PAS domain S-box-containing protein